MPPDGATVLLAGTDSDLLLLRSSMLAAAGIWSLRVRTVDQAVQVLALVPVEMAILCYTLEADDVKLLTALLQKRHPAIKRLQLAAGDDCSSTGFLRKVAEALQSPATDSQPTAEEAPPRPSMLR